MRVVYDGDFEGCDFLEIILSYKEIENVKNYKGAVKEYPRNPFNRKNKFNIFVRRSIEHTLTEEEWNNEKAI